MKTDAFLAQCIWQTTSVTKFAFPAIPRSAVFRSMVLTVHSSGLLLADNSPVQSLAFLMAFSYDVNDQVEKLTRPIEFQLVIGGNPVELPDHAVFLASSLLPPAGPKLPPNPILLYDVTEPAMQTVKSLLVP